MKLWANRPQGRRP